MVKDLAFRARRVIGVRGYNPRPFTTGINDLWRFASSHC